MNEELLNAVKQIIAKDGDAALDDAQRVNSLFADLAKDAPKPIKTAFVKCLEQGYAKIVKASPQGERASTRQKLAERLHEEEGLDAKRCFEALTVLEAALFGSAEEGVFAETKPSEPPKPAPNANPLIGTWFAKSPIMGHYHLYVEKPDEATLDCVNFFEKGDVVSAVTARYEMKISVKGSKVTLNSVSGLNILRGKVFGNLMDRQLFDFSLTMNANGTELKGSGHSRADKPREWTFTKVATREKLKIKGEEEAEQNAAPSSTSTSNSSSGASAEEWYNKGYLANSNKDYAEAFRCFQQAANGGYHHAYFYLGGYYEYGNGVQKDYAQAFAWYKKAADSGTKKAFIPLGQCYYHGNGTAVNKAAAKQWFEKAISESVNSAEAREALAKYDFTSSTTPSRPSPPTRPRVYQRGMFLSVLFGAIGGIGISMAIGWVYLLLTGAYSFPAPIFLILIAVAGFFTFNAWRNRQGLFFGLLVPALFGWLVMFGVVPEHIRGPYARKPAPVTQTVLTATTTQDVNLRAEPNGDAALIKTFTKGTTVTITGEAEGNWTPVEHDGDTGWVSSQYLTESVAQQVPAQSTAQQGSTPAASPGMVQGADLSAKLTWLRSNAQANGEYTVEVGKDETIASYTFNSANLNNKSGVTVTLVGVGGERRIQATGGGRVFTLRSNATLVLGSNITVTQNSGKGSLIGVNADSTLVMKDGAKVTGGRNDWESGAGVVVYEGGTFIMDGGEISGNTVSNSKGGGVAVGPKGSDTSMGGIFIMNGGIITGNKAGDGGGVDNWGTFTMNGGEIYGNTAGSGGGVFIGDGTFIKNASGGVIYGRDGGDKANSAGSGPAVYMYGGSSSGVYRNTTVTANEILTVVDGSKGEGAWGQ